MICKSNGVFANVSVVAAAESCVLLADTRDLRKTSIGLQAQMLSSTIQPSRLCNIFWLAGIVLDFPPSQHDGSKY